MKQIEVKVNGTVMTFSDLKYSEEELQAMWDTIVSYICKEDDVIHLGNCLIRTSSIDYAIKGF